MKKIFKFTSLSSAIILPVAIAVSCGGATKTDGKIIEDIHQGIFLKGSIQQNSNRAHIVMPTIKREKIKKYNPDLSSSYGVPMISGGFGEARHFYSTSNNPSIHMGDDVFVKAHTEIIAPYDGEIIASWGKSMVGELGGGFGAQVVMKVKTKDMNLSEKAKKAFKDEEFAFLTFGHLSQESPKLLKGHVDTQNITYRKQVWNWSYNTDISPHHSLKVKKGQVIGKVGILNENGGWVPHVHVEVYKGSSSHFIASRINKYNPKPNWSMEDFAKKYRMFSDVKGIGVYMLSRGTKEELFARFWGGDYNFTSKYGKNKGKIIKKHIEPAKSFKTTSGIIDPNLIYGLWNKESKEFTLE